MGGGGEELTPLRERTNGLCTLIMPEVWSALDQALFCSVGLNITLPLLYVISIRLGLHFIISFFKHVFQNEIQ